MDQNLTLIFFPIVECSSSHQPSIVSMSGISRETGNEHHHLYDSDARLQPLHDVTIKYTHKQQASFSFCQPNPSASLWSAQGCRRLLSKTLYSRTEPKTI